MLASPPAVEALPRICPRGSLLRVRFLETAEKTDGGVYLPECTRINMTEAEVLGVGPGRFYTPPTCVEEYRVRALPYVQPGDVVCFEQHAALTIGEDSWVDSESLLGVVLSDGNLAPLGDWVLLRPEARPIERGGIRLSDKVQRWRQKGTVISHGPGYLHVEGGCAVRRQTVPEIVNLTELPKGATVFWKRDARIIQIGRATVEAWMCRAGGLICVEEPE